METIELQSWEDFEGHVVHLQRERQARVYSGVYVSDNLYRGQADSDWLLGTTLERFVGKSLTLEQYFRTLRSTAPQVETLTGSAWQLPSVEEYMGEFRGEGLLPPDRFPAYEYFVYVRHHGFPSPLLDWTRSPYVAAYFAFRDVQSTAKKCSIYAYLEYSTGHKSGSSNIPEIRGWGPYVRSHRRHFQQQSQYTTCTVFRDGTLTYANHEDAFAQVRGDQDQLRKFNIPTTERRKVLERLEQMNVHAFSLFGSEESLMETLAIREMLLRKR
jgi:hypothetical protein